MGEGREAGVVYKKIGLCVRIYVYFMPICSEGVAIMVHGRSLKLNSLYAFVFFFGPCAGGALGERRGLIEVLDSFRVMSHIYL